MERAPKKAASRNCAGLLLRMLCRLLLRFCQFFLNIPALLHPGSLLGKRAVFALRLALLFLQDFERLCVLVRQITD